MADDRELIRERLSSLGHDELVERMLALAERDDALWLALVAEAEAVSGALDVKELRKQLTAKLRVTNRTYDWRYARRYAGEADEALDLLAALLDAGRATEVVELAEHCMKRLDTAARNIDDSGGYVRVEVDRLRELHYAACLRAAPDAEKLALRLAEWALADDSDWEWFLDAPTRYADVLGDEGLEALRRRIEPEWQKLEAVPATRDRFGVPGEAGRFRITYLRDGQVDDAVALAERAHAHAPSVTTYLELRTAAEARGDWDERRPSALERLRGADRFGGRSSAVRAQLADGDLAGAWADAREGGCDDGTWLELADASRESRPDDAGDSHYKRAVDLLQRWRATLEQHGRAGELAGDLGRIRERYKRRTRLLTRLDRAGLSFL